MRKLSDIIRGKNIRTRRHPLVTKYLFGLSGIEIGGSGKNFGLDGQKGSYANIDIIDAATRAKSKGWKKSQLVNILSPGDDLPFKDNVLEYVFSSHVIEHFFDPIKAIKEWGRVTKSGGYIFMIIPHKERTFDKHREMSGYTELINRHENKITVRDYARRTKEEKLIHENDKDKDHHRLIYNDKISDKWERFDHYDFGHHWSVWDTQSFLGLCNKMNWNVIDYNDVNKEGSDFTIILKNK